MQSGLSTLEAMEASYGLPTGTKRRCIADLYPLNLTCGKYLPGGLGGGERPHQPRVAKGADWVRDRQ
jgi:hypothetical protein